MLRPLLLLCPVIAAGIVGSAVALDARHSGDAFVARDQQQLRPLSPAAVERVVKTAPAPSAPRANGTARTGCDPRGGGEFRNPWLCRLRYRSGLVLRYRVTVSATGSYIGRAQDSGGGLIRGCCIEIGT